MRFLKVLIAALVLSSPALAQTGTVTNHAFALGKGLALPASRRFSAPLPSSRSARPRQIQSARPSAVT
jgi:hypothetical protein